MGREHRGLVEIDGASARGHALLETDEVVVRAEGRRLVLPRLGLTSSVEGDDLRLVHGQTTVVLPLGAAVAARWDGDLRHPKGRLDKLGVRAGAHCVTLGTFDGQFLAELAAVGVTTATTLAPRTPLVFLALPDAESLRLLPSVRAALAPAGVLWTVRKKGKDGLAEAAVRAAAHAAGLVDVKVARFSDTHTAEKWVVPKERR